MLVPKGMECRYGWPVLWAACTVFCMSLLYFPAPGLAADGTTPGQVTVVSLDRQLKLTAAYSGDDNGNNALLVEWDEDGGDWGTLLGSSLLEHAASPYVYTIGSLVNGQRYQVRLRWQDDNSPAEQIETGLIPCNPLIHNSRTTASSKWAGAWGVAGGQYGEFTCKTCHATATGNIKRIAPSLATPDGSNWSGAGAPDVAVFFADARDGSSDFGDDSDNHSVSDRICEVCHSQNKFHNYAVADNSGGDTGHYNQSDCMSCHKHNNGFRHGGGGLGCEACHGHDAEYEYSPGVFSVGAGSAQSHSTHTEHDADDVKGPNIACSACHDTNNYPYFKTGIDLNADGKFSLAETDVCNPCHSPGGPLDGVSDGLIGARNNWSSGVYNGSALTAGKERWCVGCHDSGTSLIAGRQAPDVAGNNLSYGYYVSGHGKAVECATCHGITLNHNFDGLRTYRSAKNNYNPAFRLKAVGGQPAMGIPSLVTGCNYNSGDFRLCYSCHSEQSLLSDTKAIGAFGCGSNPYKNAAAITTGFRNESIAGFNWGAEDIPANIHWDHLVDSESIFAKLWYSDGTAAKVRTSCPACHNVHGGTMGDGTPAPKMTRREYQLNFGTDANGSFGQIGPGASWSKCSVVCHSTTTGIKYYRPNP